MDLIRADKILKEAEEKIRIAVISDTHGNLKRASLIIKREREVARERARPFDLIIHLGDHASDLVKLAEKFDCRAIGLFGNEDKVAPPAVGPNLEAKRRGDAGDISFSDELSLEVGGVTIYATHGHIFDLNPYYGEERWREGIDALVKRAKEGGARVVLFGHTHRPFLEVVGGVLFMNPGDIYPGAEWGHIGTIEVSDGGIDAKIHRFNEKDGFESLSELRYDIPE